jgi:hypothetical protein
VGQRAQGRKKGKARKGKGNKDKVYEKRWNEKVNKRRKLEDKKTRREDGA